MKMKGLRLRTKLSLIIVASLFIVEAVWFFPSVSTRRTQLVEEQVSKLKIIAGMMKMVDDSELRSGYNILLKKYSFTDIRTLRVAPVKFPEGENFIIDKKKNVVHLKGNGYYAAYDYGKIEKGVRQYGLNIIGITLVIIVFVTGVAFVFLAINRTVRRAEEAHVMAIELEDENRRQYERLQGIMNSASEIAANMSRSTSDLKKESEDLSNNVQNQAASLEEVTSSLHNVSQATEKISDRATNQLNAMERADKMMKILAENSSRTSEQAVVALGRVSDNLKLSQDGEQNLNNAIGSMREIKETTNQITEILNVISDISDQVNLLSLNAAIEAARAGEMGKGFAVVADEIGKLAEQTNQSTKNITSLINQETERVDTGTQMVEKLGDNVRQIIQNVHQVHSFLQQMMEAAKESDKNSQEMTQIIEGIHIMSDEISQSTHEQTATGKEMASALEQINEQIQVVADSTLNFTRFMEDVARQADALSEEVRKGEKRESEEQVSDEE